MDGVYETAFLEAMHVLCIIRPIKAVISLHTMNSIVFIPDKGSVQFEAGTFFLCKIRVNFLFQSSENRTTYQSNAMETHILC